MSHSGDAESAHSLVRTKLEAGIVIGDRTVIFAQLEKCVGELIVGGDAGRIVLHGFGDGHGKAISVAVNRNVYLWQVTRGGGEIIPTE